MDIRIKPADSTDVDALHLLNTAFNGDCTTPDLIAASLASNRQELVLIAYADGEPAGFICATVCHSMCYRTPHGSVDELFVDVKYQRLGIATRLVSQMEGLLLSENVQTVDITTSVDNHGAQAFYESCGYAGKTKMIYRKRIGTIRS